MADTASPEEGPGMTDTECKESGAGLAMARTESPPPSPGARSESPPSSPGASSSKAGESPPSSPGGRASKSGNGALAATLYGSPDVNLEFGTSSDKVEQLLDESESASLDTEEAQEMQELLEHSIWHAKVVSVASIIISIIIGIIGIMVGVSGGALSVLGLAGETILDAISSAMVLQRFKKAKERPGESKEAAEHRLQQRGIERERRFTLIIGFLFVAFAIWLLITSSAHLHHQWASKFAEQTAANYSWVLAWPCCVIFTMLAGIKFCLADALGSKTLKQDAICTVFGALLAFITGTASTMEHILVQRGRDKEAFGMLDPLASIVIALLLLGEGLRVFYHNSSYCQDHKQLA